MDVIPTTPSLTSSLPESDRGRYRYEFGTEPLHERTIALDDLQGALTALADGGEEIKILVDPRL